MKTTSVTPVVACATSRLQADVMLIRLRRAGIPCSAISAFSPQHSIPNAVACWLRTDEKRTVQIGREAIVPAGRLSGEFEPHSDGADVISVLIEMGVDHPAAQQLEERLDQGHILLCVSARNENEASVAWHVFQHVSAELIVVGSDVVTTKSIPQPRGKKSAEFSAWSCAAA